MADRDSDLHNSGAEHERVITVQGMIPPREKFEIMKLIVVRLRILTRHEIKIYGKSSWKLNKWLQRYLSRNRRVFHRERESFIMEIFTKKFNEKCPSVPSDFVSRFPRLMKLHRRHTRRATLLSTCRDNYPTYLNGINGLPILIKVTETRPYVSIIRLPANTVPLYISTEHWSERRGAVHISRTTRKCITS